MEISILAAGKSSRFDKKLISHKCLLKIKNKSLVEKIIEDSRSKGIHKVSIIVGYKRQKLIKAINDKKVKYIYNRYYASKDMLYSFYLALLNQTDDLILSYSDIFYSKDIFSRLKKIKHKDKIVLPVLKNWEQIWKFRKKNIYKDCETLIFDKEKNLIEIGNKTRNKKKIMSQYMGIIYIPFKYKNLLIYEIKKIKNNKLHITNFLNKIIKKYYNVKIIETKDLWYEFDDVSDYESFFQRP